MFSTLKFKYNEVRSLQLILHAVASEAHQYFVDFISKAYQALTDLTARKNYEKYGHPDGRQVLCILFFCRCGSMNVLQTDKLTLCLFSLEYVWTSE